MQLCHVSVIGDADTQQPYTTPTTAETSNVAATGQPSHKTLATDLRQWVTSNVAATGQPSHKTLATDLRQWVAFIGKRKLKDALSNVLTEVK